MKLDDAQIKEALLRGSYITAEDMVRAEQLTRAHNISLVDAILSLGLIKKQYLGQAIAESYGVSYTNILNYSPSRELILKIPESIARKYWAACFVQEGNKIFVATPNPNQEELKKELKNIFPSEEIVFVFSFPEDIEKFFLCYRRPLATRFAEIVQAQKKIAPEITDEIIKDALIHEASDIHFEPRDKEVVIRFRISGVLYQAGQIPKEYYANILNRIKVMAHLRVDEHNASQDGAIRYQTDKGFVDIRISIVPTLDGEKVAMRLLARHVDFSTLSELGLSFENQKILHSVIQKPSGIIIVSGPTGSGKTTTLYAILKILNTPEVNITTIEDPVEYKVDGINQIQVNLQTNLTFAKGLRAIVRQDPNIILVGEIRDNETAEISINAALTGHLVLSTFHATDTASTITRLLYMDIEPSILASTLEVIITQRLVRKICESCRFGASVSQEELQKIFPDAKRYFPEESAILYKGKGCNACNGLGYSGRIAVFEFLPMMPELRELILRKPTLSDVWRIAKKHGVSSMFDDGIEKVKSGVTTLEELLRIVPPPQE